LENDGNVLTGVVAYAGSNPVTTWAGKDKQSLVEFINRFSDARTILVAPSTKEWPGSLPKS
jgi:hypothetical protein